MSLAVAMSLIYSLTMSKQRHDLTQAHVSVLSVKAFMKSNLIDNILKLECADGKSMPYFGYIQVELKSTALPVECIHNCILLVVPGTEYNTNVPILLGTNVLVEFLNTCKESLGDKFLQSANLHTPWYVAFRCLVVRERGLKKNKNRLAVIRNAEVNSITIPANSTVTV